MTGVASNSDDTPGFDAGTVAEPGCVPGLAALPALPGVPGALGRYNAPGWPQPLSSPVRTRPQPIYNAKVDFTIRITD